MQKVQIDCSAINGWQSFHELSAKAFGFPSFYGNNMDAWIDCLSYLDEPEAGMTTVHVSPGEVITLALRNVKQFQAAHPEIYAALIECSSFVNWRRIEQGEPPVLALAFNE